MIRATVLAMLASVGLVFASGPPAAAATSPPPSVGSQGTDFWLAFPGNYGGGATLTLYISGQAATSGTVTIPGLGDSYAFSVTPGTVTQVTIDSNADIESNDTVGNLGIHVTSGSPVSVYGLSDIQYTTDAYAGLPTTSLGTRYYVLAWKNDGIVAGSQFVIGGTADNTTVTITPSEDIGSHTAGTPYQITLNQGDTYQLRDDTSSTGDLTGTLITSDKPVSVFGGHECANIPNGNTYACDYVVEQMPPTTSWGTSFVTEPLAQRTGGDDFRILAQADNTHVSINGSAVATLNAGQFYETELPSGTTGNVITSDNPVLVAQYSNGSSYDGVASDPFEMLIPPYEQFLNSYTVATPVSDQEPFPYNYINVVAPQSAVGHVMLDGANIPAGDFHNIPGSSFAGAQEAVQPGSHNLSSSSPFGVFVYGFADYNSYGYPGGQGTAQVATVSNVHLSLASAQYVVGQQGCVDATVTDTNTQPVSNVRVDFVVSQNNTASGDAFTNTQGVAQFCYTGTHAGTDKVVGSVGSVSGQTNVVWTQGTGDNTPPRCSVVRHAATSTSNASADATLTDSGTGIATVKVTYVRNASYSVNGGTAYTVAHTFTFSPTMSSVTLHAVRINNAQSGVVDLTITDGAGNKTYC